MKQDNRRIVFWDEIKDIVHTCPYCGTDYGYMVLGCCGESNAHFEEYVLMDDGIAWPRTQVRIIDRENYLTTSKTKTPTGKNLS